MTTILLKVSEAAEHFDIPQAKVRGWLSHKAIESHVVKGVVHVEADQVADMVSRKCPVCLKPFTPRTARQKFCSDACRKKAHRAKQ